MPDHDPTRADRLALFMHARAAETAAHDEAVRVVERWNQAPAAGRGALSSPMIRCALTAGAPWFELQNDARDRYPQALDQTFALVPVYKPTGRKRTSGYDGPLAQ